MSDAASGASKTTTVSIPSIIHFMPGCADNAQEWKNANPGFLGVQWDEASLREVVDAVPHLRDAKPRGTEEERLIDTLAVSYTFGGVCMAAPMRGVCTLHTALLEKHPSALLIVFGDTGPDGGVLSTMDATLMISSAKIGAMMSLFDLLPRTPAGGIRKMVTDFIKASAQASHQSAVEALPMATLRSFLHRPSDASSSLDLSPLAQHLVAAAREGMSVHCAAPTAFTEALTERLRRAGAKSDAASSKHDVVLVDTQDFDFDRPVPQALQNANELQSVVGECNPDAMIVFTNAPQDQTGADMFLRQQLEFMKATPRWFPSDAQAVVWQLPGVGK